MLLPQNHKEYWSVIVIQNIQNWRVLVASGMKADIISFIGYFFHFYYFLRLF